MPVRGRDQWRAAGPYPDEETCELCEPVGTFGIVPASDHRFIGGFVDARGIRHDPLAHAVDCPAIRYTRHA